VAGDLSGRKTGKTYLQIGLPFIFVEECRFFEKLLYRMIDDDFAEEDAS
jgi:hypothetical protein